MDKGNVARATATIDAPVADVWGALVTPETISRYMFGAKVVSDFEVGSPITWSGEWKGKSFEDRGEILSVQPERLLRYSHFSPLEGKADRPENYHTVTIELSPTTDDKTVVSLTQDNNPTAEARSHSEQNWRTMLDGLQKVLAGETPARQH